MKKTTVLLLMLMSLPVFIYAQDAKDGWQIELKRISLNLTSTQVTNAQKYQGFPDSRLSADDQSVIQGDFNFFAGLYTPRGLWSNTLIMQYGKTRVVPANGSPTLVSENVDNITLTTDYALSLWNVDNFLGGFSVGPFVNAEYDTEFTPSIASPRKQVMRGRGGLKLFKGKYIKDFYVAGVYEYDFTFNPASNNFALETGINVEQEIREGVKATYGGYFRDYISNSVDRPTNLDYEAGLNARLDVLLFKNFAVAPVINYFAAQASHFGGLGQNLFVGISFSWSNVFKEAKAVKQEPAK
ncbi:MAG: hypothetical protein FWF35_02120 [Elusimicrobia bacterium]|nr:hypothetical protein [Elusimicrobiota bacterium]